MPDRAATMPYHPKIRNAECADKCAGLYWQYCDEEIVQRLFHRKMRTHVLMSGAGEIYNVFGIRRLPSRCYQALARLTLYGQYAMCRIRRYPHKNANEVEQGITAELIRTSLGIVTVILRVM